MKPKQKQLWKFTDRDDGAFVFEDPDHVTGLYYPLFNLSGMKSYVTPELKGDVCTDFHKFLTIPQVTEDFHLSRASRNFWVKVAGKKPWSATGTSAFQVAQRWDHSERARVEGEIGLFRTVRTNSDGTIEATTTTFVPSANVSSANGPNADDKVEITIVEIKNVSKKSLTVTCTSASPLFGRGAENLRDHRQVTSMFNELERTDCGVIVRPRIVHDEKGHRANATRYATFAWDANGQNPQKIWSNLAEFIGEGGSLDNPKSVFEENDGSPQAVQQGVEAVAAMRFKSVVLKPQKTASYVVLRAIAEDAQTLQNWNKKYNSILKAKLALDATRAYWKEISDALYFQTGNRDQDNLLRWVTFQPICRKVYGNSYLPDHDYGRGGRGWRDLWSDLAALFLVDPAETRDDIINNLQGIRIDGTNATIIGTRAGEFAADRNNLVRTWCDHGVWPFFILNFYVHQTGDQAVLFKEIPYWKDAIVGRGQMRDSLWRDEQGTWQKSVDGKIYKASLFEHVLVQQLSSFFNVGEHNNLRLEGADWNDTYDMARDRGESVCFFNWIAWNLKLTADWCEAIDRGGKKEIVLLKEILTLLDRLPNGKTVNYNLPKAKLQRLQEYFESVQHQVSGEKVNVRCADLSKDLRAKADFIYEHIRKNEYLKTRDGEHFFNGHYDDDARRVHGDHPNGVRIDLTSQVMAILCGTANDAQISETMHAVLRYLRNPKTGGLRLSTDLKELKLNFGRVSGFVYGWRENGSIWSQQNAMLLYGLYSRNFVREGYQLYQELLNLCLNSAQSRVFPNLPSCFRLDGKGLSCYLTGSATWLILALTTQIFGVRGEEGNLLLQPKLLREQFDKNGRAKIICNFLGKKITVEYKNPQKLDWGKYRIVSLSINGKSVASADILTTKITQPDFIKWCNQSMNHIAVTLG